MAASFHLSIDRDCGTFSLSFLSKDLGKGLDIFSRILLKPVFEETTLSFSKDLNIRTLHRIADQPQKFAFREFGRMELDVIQRSKKSPGRLNMCRKLRDRYNWMGCDLIVLAGQESDVMLIIACHYFNRVKFYTHCNNGLDL